MATSPHINQMPSPPSSSSPTSSLFAFHRARSEDPPAKTHYRTFSSSFALQTPPASPRDSQMLPPPSGRSHKSSLSSSFLSPPGTMGPDPEDSKSKKHQTSSLSARLKKSTRHLKQLFVDPASQPPPSPTAFPSLDSADYFGTTSSFEEDYGTVVSPSPTAKKPEFSPLPMIRRSGSILHPYGSDAPYAQSYDCVETEKYHHILLQRVNPNGGPFFHEPASPTSHILDIGSGTCLWPLSVAARYHKKKVTALDLVDIRPSHVPHPPNFTFVQSNFVKYRLPFEDDTFDMVRMSDLKLSIPSGSWTPVLEECYRVLKPGGHLELIQDEYKFPYVEPSPPGSEKPEYWTYPQRSSYSSSETAADSLLDDATDSVETLITEYDDPLSDGKPSPSLTDDLPFPSLPSPQYDTPEILSDASDSNFDEDLPDADARHLSDFTPMPQPVHPSWQERITASKWLEGTFDQMLWERHDIYTGPRQFLHSKLQRVFGGNDSKVAGRFTLKLATSESPSTYKGGHVRVADRTQDKVRDSEKSSEEQLATKLGVSVGDVPSSPSQPSCPGLICVQDAKISESTFLPMSAQELEYHACRDVHVLLSSKNALYSYMSSFEYEDGSRLISDADFKQHLFDYEAFRRERFGWPSTLPELSWDFSDDEPGVAQDSPRPSQDSSSSSRNSRSSRQYPPARLPPGDHAGLLPDIRMIAVYHAVKPHPATPQPLRAQGILT